MNAFGDYLMISVMKCAAGSVVLTMVLVRSFCWGGGWLHRTRMPTEIMKKSTEIHHNSLL